MGHTNFQLNRRAFIRAGLGSAAALALGPAFMRRAFAAGPVTLGDGPYGPLGPFDANGIALPSGFSSREIARGGQLVAGTAYPWHPATDGQATFPTLGRGGAPDGGWILVANSEMPVPGAGGVSGVEFAADGTIERAYRVLAGTTANCAGGPTPWGAWLSCEEHDDGRVWECDPTGALPAGIPRPAMGVFQHEAAAVDPENECVYLTEDQGDGCLYRFTPAAYPDLSEGLLEVAVVDAGLAVSWAAVPDPGGGAANPTRDQVPAATRFRGGEGIWWDDGKAYFTTKGDDRVWALDTRASSIEVVYDAREIGPDAPLSGVDNITVSPAGDIYVCEDGRDHDIVMVTPQFEVARFLKLDPVVHSGPPEGTPFEDNETVGVVFNPAGDRMYFGAQRSFAFGSPELPPGVVYEVRGPFRAEPPIEIPERRVFHVWTRKPRPVASYLRHGLPVNVFVNRRSGVSGVLKVRVRGRDGGRRWVAIGHLRTAVGVDGRVTLRVEPTARARRVLRRRRVFDARLRVYATDSSGVTLRAERHLRLYRGRPPGRAS